MKVCLLGYNLGGNRKEGARNAMFGLASYLKKSGYEVIIVTNGAVSKRQVIDGIPVIEIASSRGIYRLLFQIRAFQNGLLEVLKKEKPDIIHDHFVLPGTSLFVTLPVKKKLSRKTIWVKHVYNKSLGMKDFISLLNPFNWRYFLFEASIRICLNNRVLDKWVYQQFDRLSFHSQEIGQQISDMSIPLPSYLVPIGIETKRFPLSLSSTKKYALGYLGHPSFKKGMDFTLSSMEKILLIDPKIEVACAFSKTAEGGLVAKNRVKQLQQKYPGRIVDFSETNPGTFYSQCEVVLFPLLHDWAAISPPLSLVEALTSGSITLTSKHNGMAEIISPNKNGFVLNTVSVHEIVRQVFAILSLSTEKRTTIRSQARKTGEAFSWLKSIAAYKKLYK